MPTRSQAHIDAALTNMSVAYIQEANFIADKVFPLVPVKKQSDRYFVYNKDDWFRDEAKERARATESAGGDYDIDNTPSYFCTKYAYHKDVTEEDRINYDTPLDADQDAVDFVTQKMLLKREATWAAKFFRPGVWQHEVQGVDTTPTGEQTLQWNDDKSDPMKVVRDKKVLVQSTTGFKPNVMVLSPYVYAALAEHPAVLDRIRFTQKGVVTVDLIASLFELEEVLVADAVINSAAKGAKATTNFVMGKHALMVYRPKRAALKTPSAGYTFTWTGLLGAGAYGNRIIRLPMDHLGLGTERIEGEMAYDQKVVAKDLGVLFKDIVK